MKNLLFSSSFFPPIFLPEHALKLFESIFVAIHLDESEYLMLFLLPVVPEKELNEHIPSNSFPAPLLILFKTKVTPTNPKSTVVCVPNGVFCGVIAFFLSHKY